MAQTISLMVRAQAQIQPKAFAMSMNKVALTGTNLVFSTRSMALAWMLDVPEAGADCMSSFEERICRNGWMQVEPKEPPTTGSRAGEVSFGMTQCAFS